jgi:predicted KAP-like P-loop ATPase
MVQSEMSYQSPENPLMKPEQDRLGYASFAKYLAKSISKMDFPKGFVLAVNGSWSSGKSTLLNFIVYYLKSLPEEEQPIIVPFNPWLFSGQDDITRSFFDQLQNVLSDLTYVPKGLKERITEFAKAFAEIPLPYAQTGKAVATLFDEKLKETADLKEELEERLQQQPRRIVVTIDDIDRLPADDIQELFRIFTAIPDFSDVVYLLVFDKQTVLNTLGQAKGMTGEEYLEKIIQVPFELPPIDQTSLGKLLFEKLGEIFVDTPQELVDINYWGNIYYGGIDYFINTLRDVVHLIDRLTVSYPVVKGEVNPIDFIAVESLQLFCPNIYEIIRKNSEYFTEDSISLQKMEGMYNSWIALLADEYKQPVQNILIELFPRIKNISVKNYNAPNIKSQDQLHICCSENFPKYFRLATLEYQLTDTEINATLALAGNPNTFGENLIQLSLKKRIDGTTQLRAFLEKLQNHVQDINSEDVPTIIQAFFDVSDHLLLTQDKLSSLFDLGIEVLINRITSELLDRVEKLDKFELLKVAFYQSNALTLIQQQLVTLKQNKSLGEKELEELEEIFAKR